MAKQTASKKPGAKASPELARIRTILLDSFRDEIEQRVATLEERFTRELGGLRETVYGTVENIQSDLERAAREQADERAERARERSEVAAAQERLARGLEDQSKALESNIGSLRGGLEERARRLHEAVEAVRAEQARQIEREAERATELARLAEQTAARSAALERHLEAVEGRLGTALSELQAAVRRNDQRLDALARDLATTSAKVRAGDERAAELGVTLDQLGTEIAASLAQIRTAAVDRDALSELLSQVAAALVSDRRRG